MRGRTYVCVFVRVFMCQRRGECCGVCVSERQSGRELEECVVSCQRI